MVRSSLVVMMRAPEGLIDVPVRVEHVFEQPFQPANADAVEVAGAILPPVLADLVARAAVLGEELGAEFLVGLGRRERGRALLHELGDLLVERRQALGERRDLPIESGNPGGLEAFEDDLLLKEPRGALPCLTASSKSAAPAGEPASAVPTATAVR